MFLLGYCLLVVISGWLAWRRNPLFSARSTLRLLLAFVLTTIVVIGVILQAAKFAGHHSQAAGFSMMGAAVLFAMVVMIGVVFLVNTPGSTPPPASATIIRTYRRRVSTMAARGAWLALVLAILVIALPGAARMIVATIAGLFVFLGVALWFAGYLAARHADRCLSAIESNPWLHWTYSPDQWKQWVATEVARTPTAPTFQWRRDGHKFIWAMLGIIAGVLVFVPGPLWFRAACIAFVVPFIVLPLAFGQKSDKAAAQRVLAALSKAAPEVYFGEEGIFANGKFVPWLTTGIFLLSASIDDREPRSLAFSFSEATTNQISAVALTVPLPVGDYVAADLAKLQEHLSIRCPTATINVF